MTKVLLFVLMLVGALLVLRQLKSARSAQKPHQPIPPPAPAPKRMLSCRLCGLHVPEAEGVRSGGEFYCCADHQERHRQAGQ